VSNTRDSQFYVSAPEEALAHYEVPGIFNTDGTVNRALDNIVVERFWRSLKYEIPDTMYWSRFPVRELKETA
jgi:hypothetical protein